jgi:ABC-type sugar transport system permease subunit
MYDMAFYGYNISKATAGAIIFLFILIIFSFVFIFANRKQFVVASETFQGLSK